MADGLGPYASCYVIYRDQTDFTEGELVKIQTIARLCKIRCLKNPARCLTMELSQPLKTWVGYDASPQAHRGLYGTNPSTEREQGGCMVQPLSNQ